VARRTNSNGNHVAVIADNPQTLANLDSYFKRLGVTSSGSRSLEGDAAIPSSATALVLFPDDYESSAVEHLVTTLRRTRPKLFLVLVTSAPQHFGGATQPDGRTVPPLVLPRPAFGWTILDAIRSAESRTKQGRS